MARRVFIQVWLLHQLCVPGAVSHAGFHHLGSGQLYCTPDEDAREFHQETPNCARHIGLQLNWNHSVLLYNVNIVHWLLVPPAPLSAI